VKKVKDQSRSEVLSHCKRMLNTSMSLKIDQLMKLDKKVKTHQSNVLTNNFNSWQSYHKVRIKSHQSLKTVKIQI